MKSGKKGKFFALFALAILAASPFVFAGLGDWWATMTGKASSGTATVNVTVGNTAPKIHFVEAIPSFSPNESEIRYWAFRFNVSDADGANTLNDGTAEGNFTLVGATGTINFNNSCVSTNQDFNSTEREYICTIGMDYFDEPGTWNVNVSIRDQSGGTGTNVSTTFTYTQQNSMVIDITTLNWSSISTAEINKTADDPITINNTANANGMGVNVTAYDLRGETTTSIFIPADNFSVGAADDFTACTQDNELINATPERQTTGLTVNRGPGAPGLEVTYWCIQKLPGYATSQSYSSAYLSPWTIETTV